MRKTKKRYGILFYNINTGTWDVGYYDNTSHGTIGDTAFEVCVSGRWRETRIAFNGRDYYLVGLVGVRRLEGQRVRV